MSGQHPREDGEITFSPGLTDPTESWLWDSTSYDVYQWEADESDSEQEVVIDRPAHTVVTTHTHTYNLGSHTRIRTTTTRIITNRPNA